MQPDVSAPLLRAGAGEFEAVEGPKQRHHARPPELYLETRDATSPSAGPPSSPRKTVRARAVRALQETEQGETLFGTALKVITCGLGSGILAVPWGAAGASLGVSHLITGVVLIANLWSVMIIVHAVDRWGGTKVWDPSQNRWLGTRRRAGYRIDDLGQLLRQAPAPLPALAIVWDVTVNVSNCGALVGYMIVTGDAMPDLMAQGCIDMADRRPWILLGSLICLPLCWADLAFLTYSSAVGVAANLFLFVVLLFELMRNGAAGEICTLGIAPGALTCMSNLVFSVVIQMCIPEYYTQMRREDQDPNLFCKWVLLPSFSFIFLLMCSFSTVGYLAYGPGVSSNVLINFPDDVWGRGAELSIVMACLMVYPNMLRPMIQPCLRGAAWVRGKCARREDVPEFMSPIPSPAWSPQDSARRVSLVWNESEGGGKQFMKTTQDVYEGRLVHTELRTEKPIELDVVTGECKLDVTDTRGFERDSLVFVDGETREYAIVKEVLASKARFGRGSGSSRGGFLLLRPRYGTDPNLPEEDDEGRPLSALSDLQPPNGTKVVLDQDPVLVTAAVAGESCLHMSFTNSIAAGTTIIIGQGARAERHMVVRSAALEPEGASIEAGIRTHDLVLVLRSPLRYNQGAHTTVVLDHGPTEMAATVIVVLVMAVTFMVRDLGVVNVANGALSVAVIIGLVPGVCAWHLHKHWGAAFSDRKPNGKLQAMPLAFRYKSASALLVILSVIMGIISVFFTDNHSEDLEGSCSYSMLVSLPGELGHVSFSNESVR